MIIKCKNCGGALEFDILLQKMKCNYCGFTSEVEEVDINSSEENSMIVNTLSCTACGAKLIVNSSESATCCVYCGQPTVILDRVSKIKKPEKILPFKITREEAVKKIKSRIQKDAFSAKLFKNIDKENMKAVYRSILDI